MLNPPLLSFGLIKGTFGKFEVEPTDKRKLKIVGYEGSYTLTPELNDDDVISYPAEDIVTTPPVFGGAITNGYFEQVGIASDSGGSDVTGFTYRLDIELKDNLKPIKRTVTGVYLPTFVGNNAVDVSDIVTAGPAAPIYIGNNDRVMAGILGDPTSESYAAVVAIASGGVIIVPPDGQPPTEWEARLAALSASLDATNDEVGTKAPKASPQFTGTADFDKVDAADIVVFKITSDSLVVNGSATGKDATTADGFVTKRQLDAAAQGDIDLTGYQKKLPAGTNGRVLTATGAETYAWVAATASTVGLGKVDNTSDAEKPVSTAQQAAIDKAVGKGGNGPSSKLTWNNSTGKTFAAGDLGNTYQVAMSVATTVTLNNPNATDSGTITLDIVKTGTGVLKFTNAIIWNNRVTPTFTEPGNYLVTLAWTGRTWYGVVGVFGA